MTKDNIEDYGESLGAKFFANDSVLDNFYIHLIGRARAEEESAYVVLNLITGETYLLDQGDTVQYGCIAKSLNNLYAFPRDTRQRLMLITETAGHTFVRKKVLALK